MFSPTTLWRASCFLGATAVLTGAFGAHGLKTRLLATSSTSPAAVAEAASKIENWKTAAHYQLIHALASCVALSSAAKGGAVMRGGFGGRNGVTAATLFLAGSILFSGSIYCLVLDRERFRFAGPLTPLGGLLLTGGWVAMIL